MKMNKFTLGAIAGISALALAVPIIAQVSSAATAAPTNGTTASAAKPFTRPIPTQQQVLDMAAKDDAFLNNIDAFISLQKTAIEAHKTALTAAASVADATQRQAAVQKANDDERTAIQNGITANPGLKSASMMGFGDRGPVGRGGSERAPNSAALATKLGMTEADLKAALAGGKTIQQIAQEKGVTLPTRSGGKKGGWMMGHHPSNGTTSSTASAQQ